VLGDVIVAVSLYTTVSWYLYNLCRVSGSTMKVSVIPVGGISPVLLVYTNLTSGFSPVVLSLINWFSLSPVAPKSVALTGILHIRFPIKSPA
jgi:hypothetical protein